MEDDSLQHCNHLGSARYPVKGMKSVVATVSGYHGSERFNLIKLIDRTGASYVGNMSPSVTHVVCRRFEGRKYDIATRLKIPVVNHCWIEECAKKGRRVSEEPYTYHSGEEMGPFVLDTLLGIDHDDQAKARPKDLKNGKRPLLDAELEDNNDAVWKDSILSDEDLFPNKRQNNHDSSRSTEKAIKRNSRKGCPSSSRHDLQKVSTANIVELDEASTSWAAYSSRQEMRNLESPEFRPKGRRRVKKHIITSDEEDECEEVKLSRDSDDDIKELEYPNHEIQNSHARAAPSSSASSEKLHESANPDSTEEDSLPPASSELSCVICLTDFSSTRGVLACGHRFCFKCIQDWADKVASSGKPSPCPLCKASFICITKVEDAVSSDQKIYSQSMPNDSLNTTLYVLPDETQIHPANLSAPVCYICFSREPVDCLVSCDCCSIRCVHRGCLDPLLLPWTCLPCKDLQRLHLRYR